MTKIELSKLGFELVKEVEILLPLYHVKSDDYTILEYESDILRAKSTVLKEGGCLPDNLKDSTLISGWGSKLVQKHSALAEKVAQFHKSYNCIMQSIT